MTFSELMNNGCSFEEFIDQDKDINREKTVEIYEGIQLDENLKDRIKSIHKPFNVLVFAEIWCPDCMINVPALQKIKDINPNIHFSILPRDGNEEYLSQYKVGGKVKIPTFLILNEEFKVLGAFIETPKAVKDVVDKGNQVEIIIAKRKYRKGEYVKDTIEEILQYLENS
ncbi:thioredoxin family protein [Alkaliphilus peptidifermentans]|uniref:Thioredoxin n=1 Tax=Alkaliphilus peptidifermentans DSM 18978 TaxID=1120976 RepID=A0A1G5L1J4_9FIRM|nr:thioredoxin family protein [Alkaliphilus peptidifermentans]SCZ06059.1 Thioredoxin [Alkaliphilus peptidifermentans DSM 18978]